MNTERNMMQDRSNEEVFYLKIKNGSIHPIAFKSLCHYFSNIWEDNDEANKSIISLSKELAVANEHRARLIKMLEDLEDKIKEREKIIITQNVVIKTLEEANKRRYYFKGE